MEKRLAAYRDLMVDPARMTVTRRGRPLKVEGLTYQLLLFLLRQGSRVVSVDELMRGVWPDATVSDEAVTQRVKLLRRALGDDSRDPGYVQSVRGHGYRLVEEPRWVDAQELEPEPRTSARARGRPKWARIGLLVLLSVAVVAAGSFWMWRFAIKRDVPASPTELEALLGRAGHYLRIGERDANERAVELFDAALEIDGESLDALVGQSFAYSHRVTRYNFDHRWALQAEALARRAGEMSPRSSGVHEALAYALDAQGRVGDALDSYERAIELDPGHVASLESAAFLYQMKGELAKALETVLAARELAPDSRSSGLQIAQILGLLGFVDAAEAGFKRVFRLYPDSVFGSVAYPRFLFGQGRFAEASEASRVARERGIERAELEILDGELALLRGERQRALDLFRAAARVGTHDSLAASLAMTYADGSEDESDSGSRQASLRARKAGALEVIEAGDTTPGNWIEIALLAAAEGHTGEAAAALSRAVEAGFSDRAFLLMSPLFQNLREEPGFNSAIEKISSRLQAEKEIVLAAPWLPATLLGPDR